MASPNQYLFEDEASASAVVDRKPVVDELGLTTASLGHVERLSLAGYLHHSASSYWPTPPPLIYDWSEQALGNSPQLQQQHQLRDESGQRG